MFNNGAKFVELCTFYQIENNIFYKSPTFVTDKNLYTFCTFWDFDFSSVKCCIIAM